MKKIVFLGILVVILICSGCAKCIREESEQVIVTIVDKHYRASRPQPIRCGKSTIIITQPASYKIIVEYEGEKFTMSGSSIYNYYKDKIGEETNAVLVTKFYDDDTSKKSITSIEIPE
jgi:hypothetical protein